MNKSQILLSTLMVSTLLFAAARCGSKGDSDSSPSTGAGGPAPAPTPGPTPMTTQGNFRIIFVTTTEVNGSGVATGTGSGLASFDALCATEKTAKGFGGTFKALVGVGQRKPDGTDWILRLGKEYRREDLTTIIDVAEYDATALGVIFPFVANPLTNTITSTAKFPWTGLKNDWTLDTTNCSGWTRSDNDMTGDTLGTYGKSSINEEFVDLGYTQFWGGPLLYNEDPSADKLKCDQKHPIYCVQTKQLPPPGAYKKLFVSTGVSGAAGFAAFDAQCETDRVTKGLSGTYKAVVAGRTPNVGTVVRQVCSAADCTGATGMEQAVDWPLQAEMQYRLDDDVTYVGKTNVHGYFEGEFEEPMGSGNFWTGLTNTWATGANFQMCNGWTEPTFTGWNGQHGSVPNFGSATTVCTTSMGVICAEQ